MGNEDRWKRAEAMAAWVTALTTLALLVILVNLMTTCSM